MATTACTFCVQCNCASVYFPQSKTSPSVSESLIFSYFFLFASTYTYFFFYASCPVSTSRYSSLKTPYLCFALLLFSLPFSLFLVPLLYSTSSFLFPFYISLLPYSGPFPLPFSLFLFSFPQPWFLFSNPALFSFNSLQLKNCYTDQIHASCR